MGMQLKHPEILWALLLLSIPIVIHFFQLRRFKRTFFTNVAMLQQVVMESRKSNTLKKWILLLTRLLLVACIVMAFAQPFLANEKAFRKKETVVFLDNSFSMQAKENGLSLLEKSVQDLIKYANNEQVLSLFTNTRTHKDVTIKDIQNILLDIGHTHKQLSLKDIRLKANTLFTKDGNTEKNLVLISDFQQRMGTAQEMYGTGHDLYFVALRADPLPNVAIDSVFLETTNDRQQTLRAILSCSAGTEPVPISLYNGEKLIAKSAVDFDGGNKAEVLFSLPYDQPLDGMLQIQDNGLAYDNQFFFNINKPLRIKILAVTESEDDYLERLFTEDEFVLTKYTLNQLDYSLLNGQNAIVLNELRNIPNSLGRALATFKQDGGTIIVIPSTQSDVPSYNQFLSNYFNTRLIEGRVTPKKIMGISFEHPLYQNVFETKIQNFQYPETAHYYSVRSEAPNLLTLEGKEPFLLGMDGFFLFSASLDRNNCNFKDSPLIVPTLYNMALSSLKKPSLYRTLGKKNIVDVPIKLGKGAILGMEKEETKFIPLQRSFPKKVRLTFDDEPGSDGIFDLVAGDRPITKISFNHPRTESQQLYTDMANLPFANTKESLASLFQFLDDESSITAYWKWFVILALLLALVEVIAQKFVR